MPRSKTINIRGREMRNIAIMGIPDHSTRLHRKHLRPFAGKSITEWAIIQVQACKYITETYMVTGCSEAMEIAKAYGVRVIVEPKEWVGNAGGLGYAFNWGRNNIALEEGKRVDLYLERIAAHPLVKPGDLDRMFEIYFLGRCIEVMPAYPLRDVMIYKETSARAVKIAIQDLRGGYWMSTFTGHLREWRLFPGLQRYGSETLICEQEPWQATEVDYQEEFELAEMLFEKRILKGNPNVYEDYAKSHTAQEHDDRKHNIPVIKEITTDQEGDGHRG